MMWLDFNVLNETALVSLLVLSAFGALLQVASKCLKCISEIINTLQQEQMRRAGSALWDCMQRMMIAFKGALTSPLEARCQKSERTPITFNSLFFYGISGIFAWYSVALGVGLEASEMTYIQFMACLAVIICLLIVPGRMFKVLGDKARL